MDNYMKAQTPSNVQLQPEFFMNFNEDEPTFAKESERYASKEDVNFA